jgi:transposase-like protein
VGRVVATLTGETVSAQTVSKLTRDLDEAVRQFHRARLSDDYVYLFFDGVSLRVRRRAGRKQVQMLVAYGIRRDGNRHLLAFLRSQGESQADWEALLEDLYRRGLDAGRSRLSRLPLVPGLSHHGPAVAAGLARVAVILRLSPPPVAQLRTTNVIERCFVEVRRRTRPMVCFVNVESVDRIIYSIFQRFNLEWKTRTLNLFTQAA